MPSYSYSRVLVWDSLGGGVKVARNQRVTVTDPATGAVAAGLTQNGQPVPYVTSDGDGHVDFASTLGLVRLTSPRGFWQDVESPDLRTGALQASLDAAAAAKAAKDAAALVGTPAKTAMDAALGGDVAGLVPKVAGKADSADVTTGLAGKVGKTGTSAVIGDGAAAAMTTMNHTVAIGRDALGKGTLSRDNIGIGDSALKNVQAGSAVYSQTDLTGTRNIAFGGNAGYFLKSGYNNTVIGRNAGSCLENGFGLTAVGSNANGGYAPVGFSGEIENWAKWDVGAGQVRTTAVGSSAANKNTAPNVVAVGGDALKENKKSDNNVAVGARALTVLDVDTGFGGGTYSAMSLSGTYAQAGTVLTLTVAGHGLVVGDTAYLRLLDGASATFATDTVLAKVVTVPDVNTFTLAHPVSRAASGAASLLGKETTAQRSQNADNVAVGTAAGAGLKTGSNNVFVGGRSFEVGASSSQGVVVGRQALALATSGTNSVAVGFFAAGNMSGDATQVVALGASALRNKVDGTIMTDAFTNVVGLGYDTRASGSNQVQLGNASATVYAQSAIQLRSDERDKAEVRDTVLGLDFIDALRPVDYKWDRREDYTEFDEDGNGVGLAERDGSKRGTRFHHGLIAQEVEQVAAETGLDFGGLQDHKVNGGSDVYSIGYDEFIAPLIKAVQELSARVRELEGRPPA